MGFHTKFRFFFFFLFSCKIIKIKVKDTLRFAVMSSISRYTIPGYNISREAKVYSLAVAIFRKSSAIFIIYKLSSDLLENRESRFRSPRARSSPEKYGRKLFSSLSLARNQDRSWHPHPLALGGS
jgi:hypothetical protein